MRCKTENALSKVLTINHLSLTPLSKVVYVKLLRSKDTLTRVPNTYRQLRIKLSYVLELAEIKIFREMKKMCFPRY